MDGKESMDLVSISVVVDILMVPITDFGKFALYKHDSLPFLLDGRLV